MSAEGSMRGLRRCSQVGTENVSAPKQQEDSDHNEFPKDELWGFLFILYQLRLWK